MENTFNMACTEVLEVLKCLPLKEYKKIPNSEIEFLETQKDINYKFQINNSLKIEEMNISKKANAIIVVLWKKYFATDTQKQKLDAILKNNYNKKEEIKREKYSYDDIFKKKEKDTIAEEKTEVENKSLVEYKQSMFRKILNKIKNIFNRNFFKKKNKLNKYNIMSNK